MVQSVCVCVCVCVCVIHRYTISGRDEKALMKLLVHVDSDKVVGMHM